MSTPRIGSMCTGYGGLDMAVQEVLGGEVAWVADPDPGATAVLAHHHPGVPNLGDITATDWATVPPVDVVCGGYPCQPFSAAGKRKGTADARHLWPYIAAALRVLRPRIAIFENVDRHLRLGFDTVLTDLAELGFDAEWCLVRASEVGAPHQRARLFFIAWPTDAPPDSADVRHQRGGPARGRWSGPEDGGDAAAHAHRLQPRDDRELPAGRDALRQRLRDDAVGRREAPTDADGRGRRSDESELPARQPHVEWGPYREAIDRWERILGRAAPGPVDDRGHLNPPFVEWMQGLPAGHVTAVPGLSRRRQLIALGNGVVPRQAAYALRILMAHLREVTAA